MVVTVALAAPMDTAQSPYVLKPGFAALMDWVTFHLGFDGDSFTPDMAAGDGAGKVSGRLAFAPGVVGRAAVIGGDGAAAVFSRVGNFPVAQRGAVSLWVCPLEWDHRNDGNVVFAMTSRGAFYLQRQGPLYKPDGQVQRHEGLQFLCNAPGAGNACVMRSCDNWKNGEWHLLVANWQWPRLELSVDGGPFATKAVVRAPTEDAFGDLIVGACAGPRTLLDEVFIYRRPLTESEARLLWEALGPKRSD